VRYRDACAKRIQRISRTNTAETASVKMKTIPPIVISDSGEVNRCRIIETNLVTRSSIGA